MNKSGATIENGKQAAHWNAISHGIRSPAPVVPGLEKPEDWEVHLSGTLESLSPKGHLETVLAERIALLLWRTHRVTRYETESIALDQEKAEDDLARERRFASHGVPGTEHPEAVRDALNDARSKYQLLKALPKLEADERLLALEADTVLWNVTEYTDRVAEGEVNAGKLLAGISIPGVLDGVDWDDYEGWTAEKVRAGIQAIGWATGEDPRELLEFATDAAKSAMIRAKQATERLESDLTRISRQRLLPDGKTLEKVARYEAHLSRQLYKAMHELEALQARRLGGVAPLARLDVDGLG